MSEEERHERLNELLPFVHYMARRIHARLPPHVPLEDLVSAGTVGLAEAVNNYDPGRAVNLKAYARHRIQGAILDSLRDLDWSPRDLRRKGRALQQAGHTLTGALGRPPSDTELAQAMSMGLEQLHNLLALEQGLHLLSLDAAFDDDEPKGRYPQPSVPEDQFERCEQAELAECLRQAIDELPARDRQVMRLYYEQEINMKAVGQELGVTEGRISQIHAAALEQLRQRITELLAVPRPVRSKPQAELES